jgi:hypothetical protein
MSLKTYKELGKIVLPHLLGFKDDLTIYDKELLKNYKGKFLYGYRDSGTNIFCLDMDNFDYSLSTRETHDFLNRKIDFVGMNKHYLFFNGESFEEICSDKLKTIFKAFYDDVFKRKEYLDSLQIDRIALDLYCLMRDFKTRWRNIAINSDVPSHRRFRNHFNYEKIKIPKDFKKISGYRDIENSEEFKNIKQQLMENALWKK